MKKILIVDDSVFIRDVLKEILDSNIFVLLEAVDGREALDIYKKENPDLVLLDILMPNIDGIAAFKEMKNINPNPKVVFISAVEENEVQDKLGGFTPDGYVTKPFDVELIRKQVNEILGF